MIEIGKHVYRLVELLLTLVRWLFRYILTFLRDGTLPDDRNVLSQVGLIKCCLLVGLSLSFQLYREASYWNLNEMHKAIEEEKVSALLLSVPVITDDNMCSCTCGRLLLAWYQQQKPNEKKKCGGANYPGKIVISVKEKWCKCVRRDCSWWQAVEEEQKKKAEEEKAKKKPADWFVLFTLQFFVSYVCLV